MGLVRTQHGGLGVQELHEDLLEDGGAHCREGTRRDGAFFIHHF